MKQVTVVLTDEQAERIEAIATDRLKDESWRGHVSRTEIVRELVEIGLEAQPAKKRARK